MVNHSIKVYARVKKQSNTKSRLYQVVQKKPQFEDIVFYNDVLQHGSNTCKFRFHKVFDQDTNQGDVFDIVAKPVINSVLQGFNGTIFAYGQTGSGKTYTITGSPKNYNDRGIIPRSIQYIFAQNEKICLKPAIYISYMEIYNEIGYDLLSSRHNTNTRGLEELPRIALLEDGKGEAHIRNLSVLPVTTEQEAMRLLFLGDTNRTIAETPVNEYSSRSHCIFTIHIMFRKETSSVIRFSKLHIVDLAGSERVSKSLTTGTALNEAKYINLSLHYLQQVIVALSEEKRLHIPYRNSMMTYILKDSLSGNCLTVMMATLAASRNNFQETISTCKFAQRVSLITTEPVINEMNDPQQEIILLRRRIEELEKQIADLTGISTGPNLNNDQKEECRTEVENYLRTSLPEEEFMIKPDLKLIKFCFKLFKYKIDLQNKTNEQQRLDYHKIQNEMVALKNVVQKREAEITSLKNIIDQIPEKPTNPNTIIHNRNSSDVAQQPQYINKNDENVKTSTMPIAKTTQLKKNNSSGKNAPSVDVHIDDIVVNENEKDLFKQFMANTSNSKDLLYYTQSLEKKFKLAKVYSDAIERCQQKIIDIRQKLQTCPHNVTYKKQLLSELEEQQEIYSRSLVDLKLLKSETRHLQSGLTQAQIKIKQRFEIWLNEGHSLKSNKPPSENQWGDVPDQCDNTSVCQYNDSHSCYKQDTSCEEQRENVLSDQFNNNSSYQYGNVNDAQHCFKQDSYRNQLDTKPAYQFEYSNPCQYNNSSDAQNCVKSAGSAAMGIIERISGDPFTYHNNSGQCNNQIITQCVRQNCCQILNGKCFSHCNSHYSESVCPEYVKTNFPFQEQNGQNYKSYNKHTGKYSCVSNEDLYNTKKSNYYNQQDVYWNNGNTFINTDRVCRAEPVNMVEFQQKPASPHQMHNIQNGKKDCTYTKVCSHKHAVNTVSIEDGDKHHYHRRNGLEDVKHKSSVVRGSSRKYENHKVEISVNSSNAFNRTVDGYLTSPYDAEGVKEAPRSQDGYNQDHNDTLSSIGLLEGLRPVSPTEDASNSYLVKVSDSPEFVEFMRTVPLTGEAAIDEEIYNFYRSKLY